MDEAGDYNREKVEYVYYLLTQQAGIEMMPCKLIEDKHFATLRYDRQNGRKQHVLTASGLTGWDYGKPEHSSYERLFQLAVGLKVPHKDIRELYRRMIFNVVFANTDDHLKNHSFIYMKRKMPGIWGQPMMLHIQLMHFVNSKHPSCFIDKWKRLKIFLMMYFL
ncbi:HipA domain-containing protein [Flavobacterium branchiarum]|uniref:type II toxin-antitoxin system HipA family toxin n=1 Tax=Flavobacterium branchiarum TaxID=1114870 RepID=UPI0025B5E646|nr:HipA domain-containing protein [Flavobacterium branchiarum]MDN3673750.1 HipA domain-containing protein [Flavobacterium branchiarum]